MCLDKIKSDIDKPSDLIVDGWKGFGGSGTSLTFQNFAGAVAVDTWLSASQVRPSVEIRAGDGRKYQAGFHAYAEERDKPKHGRRVYLRRITCIGDQSGKKCLIAQEMYVPSDQDGWPPQGAAPAPAPKKRLMDRIKGGAQ
jgi:hypothetical protein